MVCIHRYQKAHFCMECGIALCTHTHASLRGSMQDKGHKGPHFNNTDPDMKWEDKDGMYHDSHQDWVTLVDYLGNPNSPFPGSNANKGETFEQAMEELIEKREKVFQDMKDNPPPSTH